MLHGGIHLLRSFGEGHPARVLARDSGQRRQRRLRGSVTRAKGDKSPASYLAQTT